MSWSYGHCILVPRDHNIVVRWVIKFWSYGIIIFWSYGPSFFGPDTSCGCVTEDTYFLHARLRASVDSSDSALSEASVPEEEEILHIPCNEIISWVSSLIMISLLASIETLCHRLRMS